MLVVDLTFWQDVPAEDSFKEIRRIASGIPMESLKKHDPNTAAFLKDDLFCFLAIKAVGEALLFGGGRDLLLESFVTSGIDGQDVHV